MSYILKKIRTTNLPMILVAIVYLFGATAFAIEPKAPKLSATSYILKDFNSGKIIAELNGNNRIEPASLTKMMASYVIDHELRLGNISMTDQVKVSEKAWKMPGSRMFIEVNTEVSVEELIKGIIIQSGNDATVAMAEYVAGTEDAFVALMNEYARQLGMENTHFVNSTGLPHKDHYTTARDLAILVEAVIRDFPEHYKWYSEKEFTYNNIKQYNRNKLLWRDSSVDGVKTGHTESAGFCLAASAEKNGMRLISVVLGTDSERARTTESQKLLTYGFRFYETHKLYDSSVSLTNAKIWKGDSDFIPLGIEEDLWITIPRGKYKSLKASISLVSKIVAPAQRGTTYGTVDVSLAGEPLLTRDLIALKDVKEGGFFDGLIDSVKMRFE